MAHLGWYPDPSGRHEHRYFDGVRWTEHVRDGDVAGIDPPPPDTEIEPPGSLTLSPVLYMAEVEPPAAPKRSKAGCLPLGLAAIGAVGLGIGILAVLAVASSGDDPPGGPVVETVEMTLAEFEQIANGMTYDQVVAIVGGDGEEQARSVAGGTETVIYAWDGDGDLGANANVTFQDGEVVSKAQYGLK